MKLHIYTRDAVGDPRIFYEAIEAKETAKQFTLQQYAQHYYNKRIPKSALGLADRDSYHQTVILTDKDDEVARGLFKQYLNEKADEHRKKIQNYENQMKNLETMEIRTIGGKS